MAFSRADMQAMFSRGIALGLYNPDHEKDVAETTQELSDAFFEHMLRSLKNEKAQAKPKDDTVKKTIEAWIKAGKPKGGPPGAMFPEWFEK